MISLSELPPLQWLLTFQQVAEYRSFTRAAMKLNVTQPAVSHKIRQLEEHLGVVLFTRSGRRTTLTKEGARFLSVIEEALSMIGEAAGALRDTDQSPHVTIRTDPEFASFWLLPVINRFNARHPRVVTSIISDRRAIVPDPQGPELDIPFGEGPWPGLTAHRLCYEEVFPVCSPTYLESCGPMQSVEDLEKTTLLGWHPSRWDFMDWDEWFDRAGAPHTAPATRLIFDDYHVAIRSAINGQGVALVWRNCLGDMLERGELVRIVPTNVLTQRGQFLIEAPGTRSSPLIESLSQWIIASSRSMLADQEKRVASS